MQETNLLKKILLRLSIEGYRLFRNNSGRAYTGHAIKTVNAPEFIKMYPGDILVKDARILHAGLGTGSPDLIGWKTETVTPEMVGKQIAIFAGVEAKTGKLKLTPDQVRWQEAIKADGGIALEVRE
jgi:hypothetical protein